MRVPLARGRVLASDRTLVMAILNATPDSFSDGGTLTAQTILPRIRQAVREGADILDVGGESTRPGHTPVAPDEQLRRVLPVIAAIRQDQPDAVVSIDTRSAEVAEAALRAGADFVNDVSGLSDPAMAEVIARHGCAVVAMRHAPLAGEPVEACRRQLVGIVTRAEAAGVPRSAVIVDPGLGFGDPPGSDSEANLRLLGGVQAWSLGLPALVGASRKRFLGTLGGAAQAQDRVGASVAAALLAAEAGAAIVRVHDVWATAQALRVWHAARRLP